MLTKTEVLAYWYKQKKYEIPLHNPSNDSMDYKDHYVLVNANNWLAAICKHPHAASSISCFNSQAGVGFYHHNMLGIYPSLTFEPDKAWLLRMNTDKTQWDLCYNFSNIVELENRVLTFYKANALDNMFTRVEENRKLLLDDVDACQGRIYQAKVAEAKEIIKLGITKDELMDYPFVGGWARIEEIDLQEAAKKILIKNNIMISGLAESESLRLRAKKAILSSTSMKQLHEAYEHFYVELSKYGNL